MTSEWVYGRLSDILQFPVPQDMIDYILSIGNTRDLEDYMRTLLDYENPQHMRFMQELLHKRKVNIGYKKSEVEEVYFAPKAEKKKKDKGNRIENLNTYKKTTPEQQTQTQGTGKKKKYVNLYSQEGQSRDIVLLKGRHKCECQASKHRLINNCLKCGRIVCEQEGSGPCLFCGSLVCSREEQELINSGNKQANQLIQKLMDKKPLGYEAAIEHRNKLLEYDRTSEKRTQVIDDESDYFSVNSVWLSPREREEMKKKEEEMQARKHQSQRNKVFTLDIGLKQMVEGKSSDGFDMEDIDEILRDISKSVHSSDTASTRSSSNYYENDNMDPLSEIQPRFVEDTYYGMDYERNQIRACRDPDTGKKVQDREYLEMADEGLCMSMHQPWASLLICGIKLHEGREWYTSHRGRLWIASTARQVSKTEIEDYENLFKALKGPAQQFPLTYPTGCLLGCVNIVTCLAQEDYRQRYPDGESHSPFVFICDSPQELPIRFPIKGKHKIYKLDTMIHQAATKCLQRIAKIKSDKNGQSLLRNS